jgi:trehalose 6-phosphate phosphatase
VETAASAVEEVATPGVTVERKGLTVTVHYRAVPLQAESVLATAKAAAERTGLVWHAGKMSVELRPPVETDKGSVVAELASGLAAVCFIGDDRGDLPAFQELARIRTRGVATLAVAVSGAETPSEVLDRADLVVEGPAGVRELLGQLDHGRL